jgi:hypothetical protein
MAEGQIASYYEDPALLAQQQRATTSANQAGAYQSAAALLPTKLKEAIQEKLDYNKDLIDQKNKAMAEYFQTPSASREKYSNIFNPMQREALVSKATQTAWQPYQTMADILQQRMGSISDMVGAGTGAFNAATIAAQNQAQQEAQSLESLMKIAQLKQAAFENTRNYNLDYYNATKPREYAPKEPKSAFEQMVEKLLMDSLDNKDNTQSELQEPPMSPARGGVKYEYPPGSGVIWVSNDQGGWD